MSPGLFPINRVVMSNDEPSPYLSGGPMSGVSSQVISASGLRGAQGTCQICGSAIPPRYTIPAARRWGSESDFHVHWCATCDAGFLLPRPSRELLETLYTNQYFSEYGKAVAVPRSVLDRVRVKLAWLVDRGVPLGPRHIEAISQSRSAKICDLGCGNGTLLADLQAHGFQVVGIEPSSFGAERRGPRESRPTKARPNLCPSSSPNGRSTSSS